MPHKSKHKQYRKEQKPQVAPIAVPPQAGAPGISQAAVVPPRPVVKPRAGVSAQSLAAIGSARYPFLTSEMKWIGIFAGIIVVLIIILALVVPRLIS